MSHRSNRQHFSSSRTNRVSLAAAAAVLIAGLVSGCSATITAEPTAPAARPVPAPSPAATLHPDGTAEDNLAYFAAVVDQVWEGPAKAQSQAYVDALAHAGFPRGDMQMTADTSTVGNPAESIQFSVRWGQAQCLVGQVGPSTGTPVTTVLPQLAGGRCLIGATPDVGGGE